MRSDHLQIIKGICTVSDAEPERAVYSRDASYAEGSTAAVVWPSNADELQRLVRFAVREKLNLVPRGGGTGLVGSAVPEDAIVVDMARFNRIFNINSAEKSAVLEAGIILDELNEKLRGYGLEFPVRPGSHAACTIGGMIATNAAGMLRGGKTADFIQELKVMDGTGKVFELKDDKIKDFIASEGHLGFILSAKLKLGELTTRQSSDLFVFDEIEKMMAKVEELKKDPEVISLEYISGKALEITGLKPREYLLVKYSSKKGSLDIEEAERLWKLRENLYSVLVAKGYSIIEDPFIPQENLAKFLVWLRLRNIPCYGHLFSGILHPHFRPAQLEFGEMLDGVEKAKGRNAGEHGIGLLKRKSTAAFAFIQRIKALKEKYDPYAILNKHKL